MGWFGGADGEVEVFGYEGTGEGMAPEVSEFKMGREAGEL